LEAKTGVALTPEGEWQLTLDYTIEKCKMKNLEMKKIFTLAEL
jgi:hypothetical protein